MRIVCEQPDASVLKTVICPRCGAKLEYAPIDIKYTPEDQCAYLSCPITRCKHMIWLRGK